MKTIQNPLPKVSAHAVVEMDGVREPRSVEMFEKLPGWWGRVPEADRTAWINAYFRRKLALKPEEILVSVTA